MALKKVFVPGKCYEISCGLDHLEIHKGNKVEDCKQYKNYYLISNEYWIMQVV